MRPSSVGLFLLFMLCVLGCGGKDQGTVAAQPRPGSVKRCLQAKGLKVGGGPAKPLAGDTDAPDRGELITAGAFIAFYSSPARAEKLAPKVRANARRLHATVARKGAISVLYLHREAQKQIEACLPS